jgi:CRISPR-associated endonuclease Csn1
MTSIIKQNSNIILSLDIGKASVGFALVDKNDNYKLIHGGVKIFDAPETPDKGVSLNKIRGRLKRVRNSNKNKFDRIKQVVKCLLKYNLLNTQNIRNYTSKKIQQLPKSKKKHLFYIKTAEYLFDKKSNANNILNLRVNALKKELSPLELARLLYSMNNHRGVTYDEIREISNTSKSLTLDQKNLQNGFTRYKNEFQKNSNQYRTIGEYLYIKYSDKFRNKEKTSKTKKKINNYYLFSIPREDLRCELETIFDTQIKLGNKYISKEFKDEFLEAFLWEKESPDYKTLVAFCFFNEQEKSASKHHISSLLYIALEKLHNIRYRNIGDKEYKNLSLEQIKIVIQNSLIIKRGIVNKYGVSYQSIKKILGLDDIEFKGIADEIKIAISFSTYIQIADILKFNFELLEEFKDENSFLHNDLVKIIEILAYKPKDSIKIEELQNLNIDEKKVQELIKIKIRGHLSYSLGVVNKLSSYMLEGIIPDDAKNKIKDEYGVKSIKKQSYLPPILDTDFPLKNNHTVLRALSQMRTVVNDILKYYRKKTSNSNWTFDTVTIELAREMNSKKEVDSINKTINKNTKLNNEAREFCIECGINNPALNQILKMKLYKLQDGIDPYVWIKNSENKLIDSCTLAKIDLNKIFDEGYCEIEHTLPFSRSLDDSQSNKTLVLSKTNQEKGNKTPYEFLNKEQFEKFEKFLKENSKSYGYDRVRKLLIKDFKGIDGFTQKDIVNTQIISKYAGLYIDKYLKFGNNPNFNGKRRVFANNGKITSILRKTWAIGKKNRDNHLHHLEDAILIACSTPTLIKNISTFINLQTQLTNGKLSLKKFNFILQKDKNFKEYILKELTKQNIDIIKIDMKDENKNKNFVSTIFKIIANKNYPYDNFRDDFKKLVQNAPVTHHVKRKSNGSIHDETISKIKNKKDKGIIIRQGIARNGEYVRCDVFKIIDQKGKITYNFLVLTAQYSGYKVQDLPIPTLRQDKTATFMFSVYKNDLLSYSLKDGSKIVGNFVKISNSIVIKEPKNIENNLFKKQLKGLKSSWSKTDDINIKEIMSDKNIQKELNIKLDKTIKLETLIQKVISLYQNVKSIIKSSYGQDVVFIMNEMDTIQTKALKQELLKENIIEEAISITQDIKNTIFITLKSSGLLPALRSDGQTTLINLKKLKVNCLGEIIKEIIQEKRKIL